MDDSLVGAEDFSDWEQVQTPFPETFPANHPPSEFNAVIVGNNCNVQAPPHHRPNSISPSPPSSSSLSTSSGSESDDEDEARNRKQPWLASPLVAANEVGRRLRLRLGVMSVRVLRLASKGPGGFWAVASMTGAVTVALLSLLYARVLKRWRLTVYHHDMERLVFLLRRKDEKIRQLSLQVAQMTEILSARRRVPVIRIG